MKFQVIKQLSVSIALTLLSYQLLAAQTESELVYKSQPGNFQLSIQSSGVFLQNEIDSLNGLDFAAVIKYSLSPNWALHGGFRQAFDSSDFAVMYSNVSTGIDYSPKGILQKSTSRVDVGFSEIVKKVEHTQSGWIYGASVNQYFFNGVNNVYPLVGPELSVKYQMMSRSRWHNQVGSAIGYSRNGDKSALVFRVFWDIGYWL